jgi:hypothetical protein
MTFVNNRVPLEYSRNPWWNFQTNQGTVCSEWINIKIIREMQVCPTLELDSSLAAGTMAKHLTHANTVLMLHKIIILNYFRNSWRGTTTEPVPLGRRKEQFPQDSSFWQHRSVTPQLAHIYLERRIIIQYLRWKN